MLRTRKKWNQIFGGIAMLVIWAIATFIGLYGTNALGLKTLAYLMFVIAVAAWVITGVVLIACGFNK